MNSMNQKNVKNDDENQRTGSAQLHQDDLQTEKSQQNSAKLNREEQAPE